VGTAETSAAVIRMEMFRWVWSQVTA